EGAEPPEKRSVVGEPRQLTFGDASGGGGEVTADGMEVLSVPDVIETDRRDLRSRLVAISTARDDGGGADAASRGDETTAAAQRELIGTDANLSIGEFAVAPDGAVAVLASDVGAEGVDFVAPGTA